VKLLVATSNQGKMVDHWTVTPGVAASTQMPAALSTGLPSTDSTQSATVLSSFASVSPSSPDGRKAFALDVQLQELTALKARVLGAAIIVVAAALGRCGEREGEAGVAAPERRCSNSLSNWCLTSGRKAP